jgi:surfactin synthase thioesterase subunit
VLADAEPTFALAGFSMGGYVAQEIARIAPAAHRAPGPAGHLDPAG